MQRLQNPFDNKTEQELKNGFYSLLDLQFAARHWKTTQFKAELRLLKGEKPE